MGVELNSIKLFWKSDLCWCELGDIRLQYLLVIGELEVTSVLRVNNNKEVNSVKKTDKPSVVINIYGDNNKVYLNETQSHIPAVAINVIIVALLAVAVLTISRCCPELLPDFVCWIIGKVVNS